MGRPYMGKEKDSEISWDTTKEVEGLEGFQIASSEFVNQYTSENADKGKVQKLFIAEVNASDGSVFQVPVVESMKEVSEKAKAQTKVASKFTFPTEQLQTTKTTSISIRPFKGKESETQITWNATKEVDDLLEGYEIASTELVDQYASDKADKGMIQKLFIAEIKSTDGASLQVPVIESISENVSKVKAQTRLASKLKIPTEKAKLSEKTTINIRPYKGKQFETKVVWNSTKEIKGLEGYRLASSGFVDQYTSEKAKAGKIQKLFVAEVNSSDGASFQIPVIAKMSKMLRRSKHRQKLLPSSSFLRKN